MRICYHCGRFTGGTPLFCNTCGLSYNTKFCPRLHPNDRRAEACSRCGSRDLSQPQPKPPFWFRPLMFLTGVVPGLALLFFSIIYFGYFLIQIFVNSSRLLILMFIGFLLGLTWLLFMHVPYFLIRLMLRLRRRR